MNIMHSRKDKIPLRSVSDGIWSETGNSKEFHFVMNSDEAAKKAAVVNSRADRLRSSVIHEQKHFLGKRRDGPERAFNGIKSTLWLV